MNAPESHRLIFLAAAGLIASCSRSRPESTPQIHASGSASVVIVPSTPPSASASSAASATPPTKGPSLGGVSSGGVSSWEAAESLKGCVSHSRELDSNLAFGSLSIASRGKDLAVVRFLRTGAKGEGQLAFGGYDVQTRTVATSHGLGKALFSPPWVFARKEDWGVFWFDAQSLVFTRTGWAATVSKIARFAAIPIEEADRVTLLGALQENTLIGVASLSIEPTSQLGLFSFVPGEHLAENVKAIGATHHAVRPKAPTAAVTAERYFLAWEDTLTAGGPSVVVLTSFDPNGREIGPQIPVSTRGVAAKQPTSVLHKDGILLAWTQYGTSGSEVVVQSFDKDLHPLGDLQRIDQGERPVLTATKEGAVLGFLRHKADPKLAHAAVAFVDSKGVPSPRGLLLSHPDHAKDTLSETPGITSNEDGWIGMVFTFSSGMRSQLRTFKLDCFGNP